MNAAIPVFVIVIILAACVAGAAFYASFKQRRPHVDTGECCYLTLGEEGSGILYQLLNQKGKVIYKAVFADKLSETGYKAKFVNCVKRHSTLRNIDSAPTKSNDPSFSARPSFTYENKNIWDYLKERGVRVERTTVYSNKTICWVYNRGEKMATVEKAGGRHKRTTYRVRVFDDRMYLVFLSAFTIATLGFDE